MSRINLKLNGKPHMLNICSKDAVTVSGYHGVRNPAPVDKALNNKHHKAKDNEISTIV